MSRRAATLESIPVQSSQLIRCPRVDGWERPRDLQAQQGDKPQFMLAEEVHLLHQCPGVFLF